MILQALKNMYPKASEKVLQAVMKDLEKCRGKNMSTEELADWIGKLVTAHTIEEALPALLMASQKCPCKQTFLLHGIIRYRN